MHTDARYMSHLLDCLHQHRQPAGGLAFPALWDKLALDYTAASLVRLTALLRGIGARQGGKAFSRLNSERAGQNFLLTLTAYLAEYVARQSGTAYMWQPDGKASFGGWQFQPLLILRLMLEGQKDTLNLDDTVWQAFRLNPEADRTQMSAFLLEHFRRHGSAPQGLAFAKELAALPPQDDHAALDAVNALLLHLHESENITPDTFHSRFDHYAGKNFMLLLAFRVGNILAAESGSPPQWCNTPHEGDPFYDGFVLQWQDGSLPLLRLLKRALCSGTALFAPPAAAVPPPDPDEAARRTVDGLLNPHCGGDGGLPLAHAAELQNAGLDYSLHSLVKIDKLLARLRTQRHDFDRFVRDPACLNFLHFCAFYLARTAAALSRNNLQFIGHAEACRQIPDLPEDWFSQYAAVIGSQIYFPFGHILSLVWDRRPDTACATFAQNICLAQSGHLYVFPADQAAGNPALLPELWQKILYQAGLAAARALHTRQNGTPCTPVLVEPHPDRHWHTTPLVFERPEEALAHGLDRLAANPDNAPCRLLCREDTAYLPRGRFNALLADVRAHRDRPLRLQTTLPFIRDADGSFHVGALAVDSPQFASVKEAAAAAACVYRGMDDFHTDTTPKGHWRTLYRFDL